MRGIRARKRRRRAPRRVFDSASGWRAAAELATRQHGVVARKQLLGLGLGSNAVDHGLRNARLHRVRRGVYLVGHRAATPQARLMAALLACRLAGALGDETALRCWGLAAGPVDAMPIHVTVAGRNPGRKPGLLIHRAGELPESEVRMKDGLRLTSPARTILDVAARRRLDELEAIVAEALASHVVRRAELEAMAAAHPTHHGAAALRRVLGREGGPAFTRSAAERRLLALLRRAAVDAPRVNARLHGFEVDFLWPQERVVVEVDGFRYHANRRSFERDRSRDAALAARGYRVMRVTWRQLVEQPERVLARIAAILATAA
jgi:very-short-patch-repair endonuclease